MAEETNQIVIAKPDVKSLSEEASGLIVKANEIEVTNRDEHGIALTFIKELRSKEKRIAEHFEPARAALDVAKKEILAARDSLVKPLAAARGIISDKATVYEDEQTRIAEEVARKLRIEAEEAERKIRLEAEKAEKERLAALEKAVDEDDEEKFDELIDAPAPEPPAPVAPVPIVTPDVAQVQGISIRKMYSAEITNKMALIEYVATHPEWKGFLEPNMPVLNKLAATQKDELSIPGVKAVSKTVRTA